MQFLYAATTMNEIGAKLAKLRASQLDRLLPNKIGVERKEASSDSFRLSIAT